MEDPNITEGQTVETEATDVVAETPVVEEGVANEAAQATDADTAEKKTDGEQASSNPAADSGDRSAFNCQPCKGEGLLDENTVCQTCGGTGKV